MKVKQGSMTVTTYYNALNRFWQEIDLYQDYNLKCAEETVQYKQVIEKYRGFDFLAGLNAEPDQIRSQILGKDPIPSLREVYNAIRREES